MARALEPSPTSDALRFLTVADLSAGDFLKAKRLAGFSSWAQLDDFEFEREAMAMSYEAAGVRAPRQRVPFVAFEGWSRLTGAPLDPDGLDEFAAHWRYRAQHPDAATHGCFGDPGHPERNPVAVDAVQVIRVREDVYDRWRDAFATHAPFPAPALDVYATLVVDCCLMPSNRAWRSATRAA